MSLSDELTRLEITWRWFSLKTLLIAAFAVLWNGFMFHWYGNLPANAPLIAILFPLLHVGVGVGLAYQALTGFVNRTRIRVDDTMLTVRHGPLPWIGNRDIDRWDVKQLYVSERVSRGRGGANVSFDVRLVTNTGRNVRLVRGMPEREQALYVEHKIENHLKIDDAVMPGEVPKARN